MIQLNNRLMPQDYEARNENVGSFYLKKYGGQQEDPDPPASPGNKHRLLKLLLLICAMLVAVIIFLTVYQNVSCAEGWLLFDLKCYFFSTDKMTWQLSQEQCMSMGGHLVVIESMEEENFLEDKANILTGEQYGYWIGLTDLEKEGQFVWVDSRPLDPKYRFWEGTEPNGGQDENCVQMWLLYQWKRWHDFPCETTARRICEAFAALLPI